MLASAPSTMMSPVFTSGPIPTAGTVLKVDHEEQPIYTIDDLIRARAAEKTADEPIVAYPSLGTEHVYHTPRQLNNIIESAAAYYSKTVPQRRSSTDPVQVVGLLGVSNFEYLITLLAISRLGHTVLFLSTRIVEDALVSLLKTTKASFLITYADLNATGERVSKRTAVIQLPVLDMPTLRASVLPQAERDGLIESKHIAWIIHSSGSTGLPKPIYQTHSGALGNYVNNFGLRGYITLPLFHAHGISCVFRAIYSRKLIYMYNTSLPLTATILLATLREHPDIEALYAVPYALKLLSESEEGLRSMARLKLVMFGGSSCSKPVGDMLVLNGVCLVSHYGTTETGQLMTSFREQSDQDWDYVRPIPLSLPYLRWEEQSDAPGIYELCVLDGWPSKVASNRADGSYATKDLFEKHPSRPNAWRYYARLDDTLVLENGEKANPLTIEGVVRKNPNVKDAIVFGVGRPRLGLFVVPSEECQLGADQELVDSIFLDIDKCNKASPAYAFISRDMIHALPRGISYRMTDKGTIIRSAFYKDFADNIDKVYANLDQQGDLAPNGIELLHFLRRVLIEIAPSIEQGKLDDSTDIFSLGIDSLQSIRMRSTIARALNLGGQKLPQNFVFEHPSLSAMANEIIRLQLGCKFGEKFSVEERMQNLIEKYGCNFKKHVAVQREPDLHGGEYVVLTGATGSLGAHIAAQLAQSEQVNKVYCLVRATSYISARTRIAQSLHARAVSFTLPPAAQRKIIALPADLSMRQNLGLEERVFLQLKRSATTVIHCAWSVNFNWALESFEESCIAATRNLLDFCLSIEGPRAASFAFCSSISTVARTPGNRAREALPESLSYAQGTGYAQSKLVAENIVSRAVQQTGMMAQVLRAGQIAADTVNGIWNAAEAIPMILQTAKTIGALPQLDEVFSWIPADVMATIIIELSLRPSPAEVMNVVNPAQNHWTRDLLPLLKNAGLKFEELPMETWLQRLKESNPDPEANPPIKLLDFFVSKYGSSPGRTLLYETGKACAAFPALAHMHGLTQGFVSQFVKYLSAQAWANGCSSAQAYNIFVLVGPHGCGKHTAARMLAERLGILVVNGDSFRYPPSFEDGTSVPLWQHSDYRNWLAHVRGAVTSRLLGSTSLATAVVVTLSCQTLVTACSDELRRLPQLLDSPAVTTFLLFSTLGSHQRDEQRATQCSTDTSYMRPSINGSQLDAPEEPAGGYDMILIDSSQPRGEMLEYVFRTICSLMRP